MIKRITDLLLGTLLLLVSLPLWFLAALAIKVDSRGPVLYRSQRIGRDAEPFLLYKFRTMRVEPAGSGPRVTRKTDPRITRAGRWLRASKIDELPQLVNVIKGEMSIVGPRPEDPRYVPSYSAEQLRVLTVRPGLTSPAVIAYRDEEALLEGAQDVETTYLTEILPAKLALDLRYVDEQSIALDLRIIGRTVLSILTPGRSAH